MGQLTRTLFFDCQLSEELTIQRNIGLTDRATRTIQSKFFFKDLKLQDLIDKIFKVLPPRIDWTGTRHDRSFHEMVNYTKTIS